MEQLRLALVGCGGMAGAHVGGLKELREAGVDDIEVVACCDRVEEAAQQRAAEIAGFQDHEPAIHTDVDEMLVRVDGLDAVDICAPHSQHHLLAVACGRSTAARAASTGRPGSGPVGGRTCPPNRWWRNTGRACRQRRANGSSPAAWRTLSQRS